MHPLLLGMIWTFSAGGKLFAYQSGASRDDGCGCDGGARDLRAVFCANHFRSTRL
jgi:hypothetical protein